jgi:hypothetical protein
VSAFTAGARQRSRSPFTRPQTASLANGKASQARHFLLPNPRHSIRSDRCPTTIEILLQRIHTLRTTNHKEPIMPAIIELNRRLTHRYVDTHSNLDQWEDKSVTVKCLPGKRFNPYYGAKRDRVK